MGYPFIQNTGRSHFQKLPEEAIQTNRTLSYFDNRFNLCGCMKIKGYISEKRVSVSEAKSGLNKLIESDGPTTILKNGKEKAVLIPHDKYINMFRLWHENECINHQK